MGGLCSGMTADEADAAKKSKEVDQLNEAAFKKASLPSQLAFPPPGLCLSSLLSFSEVPLREVLSLFPLQPLLIILLNDCQKEMDCFWLLRTAVVPLNLCSFSTTRLPNRERIGSNISLRLWSADSGI
jgi:hypothetical protein